MKFLMRLVTSLGWWVALSVVAVVSVGALGTVVYWDWMRDGTGAFNNSAHIRNAALVVGGVVAILLALWRSLVAERQATAARRQSETAERAYVNERYRQAAEMLGHGELPVRLGGLFALKRLARDHPAEFRQEVLELLVEFVRSPPAGQQDQPMVWDMWLRLERPAVRQDVQAAAIAIVTMVNSTVDQEDTTLQQALDFREAKLCSVDLTGLRLCGADLRNADLTFARLDRADLGDAQLQGANGRYARLTEANLFGADMSDADFSDAHAFDATFCTAVMPARMVNARLCEADFTGAKFRNTDLSGADLHRANLSAAQFAGTRYWISHAGPHEGKPEDVRISQEQLDEAVADPEQPPNLVRLSILDESTGKPLVWRGKAP